jgi:hypothetical protein
MQDTGVGYCDDAGVTLALAAKLVQQFGLRWAIHAGLGARANFMAADVCMARTWAPAKIAAPQDPRFHARP